MVQCTVQSCLFHPPLICIHNKEHGEHGIIQFAQHQYIVLYASKCFFFIYPRCFHNRLLPRIANYDLMHKYK